MPYITAFRGLWADLIISTWSPCEPMHWQSPELLSGCQFQLAQVHQIYDSGLIQLGQGLVNIHIGNVRNRLYRSGWIDLKRMFSFSGHVASFPPLPVLLLQGTEFCNVCQKYLFKDGRLLCVSQYVSKWEEQCCYMNFSPYGYPSNPAHWMHIDGKAFQDKSEESSACSVYLFHKLHVLLHREKKKKKGF